MQKKRPNDSSGRGASGGMYPKKKSKAIPIFIFAFVIGVIILASL